jgi:hypothetical protein
MRDAETFIREHVRRILAEKKAASRDLKVVRGRIGRGDWQKATKLAGSLADTDPGALVEKLGLEGFELAGSGPEERVLSLVQKAITTAPVMREAYGGAEVVQDEEGVPFIRIKPGQGLSPRDAAQYMFLALVAAANTGLLSGINKTVMPGLDAEGQAGIFFAERKAPKKAASSPKGEEPKKEPAAG